MERQNLLYLATALITDEEDHVLMVRKRGTEFFMQPGGKIGPGETPEQALIREIEEELAVKITRDQCHRLGAFHCAAANEPNTLIHATLFFIENVQSFETCAPSGTYTHKLGGHIFCFVIPSCPTIWRIS